MNPTPLTPATHLLNRGKRLHDLPPEIIYFIFEQITVKDYWSAIMFAHADAFLWQCGEPHLRKLYKEYIGPCTGHRLICIGAHAEDLPAHLETPRELDRMRRLLDPLVAESFSNTDGEGYMGVCTSSSVLGAHVTTDDVEGNAEEDTALIMRIANTMYSRCCERMLESGIPSALFSRESNLWWSGIEDWFYENERDLPEPGHTHSRVLRNLSQRVFVRSDTLNEIMIGRPENRGLGSVLVAHICWSTDPSTATPYNGLHRGIWAGDRFDIVPLKDFDAGGPGWEDVTASVASTMVDIWEADFAGRESWRSHWRETYGMV